MKIETIGQAVIAQASQFVDMYESKNNAAWSSVYDPAKGKVLNTELHDTMVKCGWLDGEAYCISFAKACWLLAYKSLNAPQPVIDQFMKLINPSVMDSYHKLGKLITKEPVPGSIMFFQLGGTAHGHAGIVASSDGKLVATIEGNTSPGKAASVAADRNGDGIYKKVRHLDFAITSNLHLVGFLQPIAW